MPIHHDFLKQPPSVWLATSALEIWCVSQVAQGGDSLDTAVLFAKFCRQPRAERVVSPRYVLLECYHMFSERGGQEV